MSVNTSDEYLDELLHEIDTIIYKDDPVKVQQPVMEPAVVHSMEPEINIPVSPVEVYTDAPAMEEAVSEVFSVEETPALDSFVQEDANLTENMQDAGSKMESGDGFDEINLPEGVSEENDFTQKADFGEEFSLENLVAEVAGDIDAGEESGVAQEDSVSMDELLAAMSSEESMDGDEMDVDAMLNAAVEAATGTAVNDSTSQNDDVKELLKQFSEDEDLADISEILDRNDNSEAVDEAVLEVPDVEVFQLEEEVEEEEEETEPKKKKGLFSRFKKDKKKKNKKDKEDKKEEIVDEISDETTVTELVDDGLEMDLGTLEVVPEMDLSSNATEPVELDTMDLGSLMELGGEEIMPISEGEMSLDGLLDAGDLMDIDQLLAAGSFEEIGEDELLGGSKKGKSGDKQEEKKQTFFGKLFSVLFDEDEDEEAKKNGVPEADATGITDENKEILGELSKEEKKKRKLEEKERKKKEKEAKKAGKTLEDGEVEGEEDEEKGKKKKKKKVKKPKPRAVVDIDEKPEKNLSPKKVKIVFLFCFSILVVILLFQSVVMGLSNLKEARWAFDNADYENCYLKLYGEELSEEDELIFQKSYVVLSMQRKLDSYDNFIRMDMGVEALNALFDGVRLYRNIDEKASELGMTEQVSAIYQTIYGKLGEYGLSNEQIEEILAYKSKVTYTKRLDSIVNGTPFVVEEISIPEENAEEMKEDGVLDIQSFEDVLPQEEDFLPNDSMQRDVTMKGDSMSQEPQTTVEVGSTTSGLQQSGGGENVGNGNTNVEVPVNGNSVIAF